MNASKRKRLLIILAGMAASLALYLGAYFACVSVHYWHPPEYKVQSIQEAYARYNVGPLPQDAARWLFKPAQLFDALYLRPSLWEDRQQGL